MSWNYAYTPTIWPSVITTLLYIMLVVFTWRRRSVPGALPFLIACLFGAAWAGGSVMEYTALDLTTKIFWVKLQAASKLSGVTAITFFFLEYTWPGRWLTRRNLALLSMIVVLGLGLIFTNDLHHWIWRGFPFDGTVTPLVNTGGWLLIAYGYGLALINLAVLGWLALRSPQHRWLAALIMTSQVSSRVLFLLDKALVVPSAPPLDLLGLGLECLVYALALFGFRLFDPVALSRLTLMEQLKDGMLVLDRQGRIASLNPAAEWILATPAGQVKGRPVWEFLPAYPTGTAAYPEVPQPGTRETETEFSLATGEKSIRKTGHYRLVISPLNDWRGQEVGRMLLLHDITEQKQAQAQLLEQNRALAILTERERLARELHDSTGQVLGYVNFQALAIARWLQEGEVEKAGAQLARLAGVAKDAHADLRGSILNLRSGDPDNWSFLAALQHYLADFQEYYGVCAELVVPSYLGEDDFPPGAGVHLVRVIQEALTNARKHSQAKNVRVGLARQDSRLTVEVIDDGIGFDPAALPGDGLRHYGLAFMRERVEQLGGDLRIESAAGQGTRLIVELPENGKP